MDSQTINTLLSSIEEYVSLNKGFANLGEAEAYKKGCHITNHRAPAFIIEYYNIMAEDRWEEPCIPNLSCLDDSKRS